MLQKDKEFDRIVRSMLENAEEEVPEGVWEAVSASLPSGAPGRKVLPWWGRVAAGVAVAASLVGGIFLWNSHNSNPDIDRPVAIVRDNASAPETTLLADDLTAEDRTVTESGVASPSPVAVTRPVIHPLPGEDAGLARQEEVPSSRVDQPVKEEAATAQPEAAPGNAASAQTVPENPRKSAGEKTVKQDKPAAAPSGVDPFALLEWEDRQKADHGRASVTLGGDFASNGNPRTRVRGPMARGSENRIPTETEIKEVSVKSNYSIPISFGLGLRIPLSQRFSLGTGLTYSILGRSFTGIYMPVENGEVGKTITADIQHTVHYAGIPLQLYYDIISGDRIRFYVNAGGSVEKVVVNRYLIPSDNGGIKYTEPVRNLLGSVDGGIGIEFRLTDNLGIYVDPSCRYYFGKGQPPSIRTRQPMTVNFEVGLRFGL